jgi:hypothetical protein
MKLIQIEQTTVLRFFLPSNIHGQLFVPDFVNALARQYNFVEQPEFKSESLQALDFVHGKHKDFAIGKLSIYSDGVIVKSQTNAEQLDEFLISLEGWITSNFRLELFPISDVSAIYESAIVVKLECDIMKIFKKMSKIEKSIETRLSNRSSLRSKCTLAGFTINVEAAGELSGLKPIPFRIEPKLGTDPKLLYFFSTAPLATSDHLGLIQELTALAA